MNRRDALKKLAAGGVVAAGAPLVLSSFEVAAAASPPGTSLTGVPESGEPLLFTHDVVNGLVLIADATTATCTAGTMTRTYEWSLHAYDVDHVNRRLQVRNANNTATLIDGPTEDTCTTGCPTPYTLPSTVDSGITLRKLQSNPLQQRTLDTGDTYVLQVRVTWHCSGSAALQAEYRLSGTYPTAPTVTNQSYTIL